MDNPTALERFSRLEAAATQAAQAGAGERQASPVLNEAMQELERRAHDVRSLLQQELGEEAADPAALLEAADLLKTAGDRAAQLCEEAGACAALHHAIEALQNEIAHFRRQLHGGGGMRREQRPLHPGAR